MISKKVLLQNLLLALPFLHLYIINKFQIRNAEIIKLFLFSIIYLSLFNFLRYFLIKVNFLKNSDYFVVIFFYLSFNYSAITIYIYFEAFDFVKNIPNYSFIIFLLILLSFLILSQKLIFAKLFEFFTISYVIFLIIVSINTLLINKENKIIDFQTSEIINDVRLNSKPDIYFVIFDGLPSLATMEKYYNYDTTKFNNLFNEYNYSTYNIASSSYGRTTYTLSSIFELDYIFESGNVPFRNREELTNSFLEGDSVFENILRKNQYSLYKFGLAFNCNEILNDKCITQEINNYKEKDSVYFDLVMRTPLKILIEKGILKLSPRISTGCVNGCVDPEINEIFEYIDTIDKPKAVFLHFMDTHGPYLLGENCSLLSEPIYDLPKTNLKSYQKSLDCAFLKIKNLIEIIDNNNSVVFIQSDHGPNYESFELTNISELSTNQILNRYSAFSISNLANFCEGEKINLNELINTFNYFINCFSSNNVHLPEVKNFLAFGKIDSLVYEITSVVQNTLKNNYK